MSPWKFLLVLLLVPGLLCAREVAGVDLEDEATLANGETLVLNGAGIRTKFFVKVYVGALYLPHSTADVAEALAMPGGRRVVMHFLYDGVSAQKIVAGWTDGFRNNLSPAAFQALQPRLQHFNALFTDTREGDRIQLDYLPGQGTQVTITGLEKGLIEGEDFMRALLSVWLGEEPADSGLKAAMLGER